MKKNLIIITILFMLLGVFGISQVTNVKEESKVESKEVYEAKKEEVMEETEDVGFINEKSNEYTGLENIKIVFEKEYTDNATCYMVVTAYDVNTNKVLWSYKSDEDYVGQLDYLDYVYDEEDNEKVYIVTEGKLSKLDMTTGNVVWSNNKVGAKLYSGVSHKDKLYFMGAYDDTMYILDSNKGKLIDTIKVNSGEYTYEFFTSMEDTLIFEYFAEDTQYLEFDTNTNTVINK